MMDDGAVQASLSFDSFDRFMVRSAAVRCVAHTAKPTTADRERGTGTWYRTIHMLVRARTTSLEMSKRDVQSNASLSRDPEEALWNV
jgi:hypothetical protein